MLFRRRGLSREKTLAAKPIRNELATWQRDEKGEVVIRVPLRERSLVRKAASFFGLPDHKEIWLFDY